MCGVHRLGQCVLNWLLLFVIVYAIVRAADRTSTQSKPFYLNKENVSKSPPPHIFAQFWHIFIYRASVYILVFAFTDRQTLDDKTCHVIMNTSIYTIFSILLKFFLSFIVIKILSSPPHNALLSSFRFC